MRQSGLGVIRGTKRGALALGMKLSEAGLGFLASVLLARWLGISHFGIYSFALAVVTVISMPCQFGLPNLVIRETARLLSTQKQSELGELWRWAERMTLWLSAAVAGAGLAWCIATIRVKGFTESTITLSLGMLLVPLMGVAGVRSAALRGLGQPLLGAVSESLVRPAVLVLGILICLLTVRQLQSASVAITINLVAALISFITASLLLPTRRWRIPPLSRQERKKNHNEWLSSAIPFALTGGIAVLNSHVDILMVGLIIGETEVGAYKAAVAVSALVSFGLLGANLLMAPTFARLYSEGKLNELQAAINRAAVGILAIALPSVVLLIALGEWLLSTAFGSEFEIAGAALGILAMGQLVNASAGSVGLLLNMAKRERIVLKTSAICVSINVALNVVLIPRLGLTGAALATAVSLIVWNAQLCRAARSELAVDPLHFLKLRWK